MNKKFSTLLASFLLAGGLFSTASAENVLKAIPGQYYQLKGTAYWNPEKTPDAGWEDQLYDYYLATDENGKVVYSMGESDSDKSYWTIEIKENASGNSNVRFVNVATGQPLKLTIGTTEESTEWFAVDYSAEIVTSLGEDGNAIYFVKDGKKYYLSNTGSELSVTLQENTVKYPRALSAIEVPATVYNATNNNIDALADDNGNGETFNLSIGAQVWNKDESKWEGFESYNPLNGNVFTGDLTAKKVGSEMRLLNSDGKYIVLINQKWGGFDGEAVTGAMSYKFALATDKNITDKKVGDYNILASDFCIAKPATETGAPVEVVALGSSAYDTNNEKYELRVAVVDEDNAYLTVATDKNDEAADYTVGDNNNGKPADNTYVRFGADNNVDYAIFYDKLWNITREDVNGGAVEVADPSQNNNFIPVAHVFFSHPATHGIYTSNRTFINRESGHTVTISALRTTETANVYTDGSDNYTIVAVGEPGNYKDGYFGFEYNAEQLKVKTFRIGTPVASTGDTTYMTLGDDKQIAWNTDATEAIEFRFTQVLDENDLNLLMHITDYEGLDKDGNIVGKEDTLSLYRYNIADLNGRVLYYNDKNDRYELLKVTKGTGTNAGKYYDENNEEVDLISIVLKAKDNNCYNILREIAKNSDFLGTANTDDKYIPAENFCNLDKLYGSHNSNELTGDVDNYAFVQNDLFVIEDAIANLYRSVGTTAALDTIKIFRNEDNNYVMYESGKLATIAEDDLEGFLAIQNFLDPRFAEKNPAMYADTAAGFNTWRPQFMLAVDATIVPAGKWCEEHKSSTCAHAVPTPGYVEGRYLVNLNDSVNTKGVEREDCMYQNFEADDNYYRLGFVHAKHIGDTLVIASTGDSISLLNNELDKYCTFAFRYVDNESEAFIIETAYSVDTAKVDDVTAGKAEKVGDIMSSKVGYIKYHNGVPVVTSQRSEAEVFDLEVLENIIPTANETIADEAEGVQVIAGNGAVTIQGAAGKTVVITNILGKAVANTTLTSDNQTINVPAGIVVVTVDGEAVKAIVK